ncbi:hypothetical protein B9Z55_005212 [Caenorhabditis nigoni]|uniref:Uncharacterized protein n=1 Tax=Caenorhabditis nigoni TaxID=1611254 RepID=A0A2G5UZV7_9PELO|nr:hypothetical protein B9Z55_005212 [Caenorhabditis nigoni]
MCLPKSNSYPVVAKATDGPLADQGIPEHALEQIVDQAVPEGFAQQQIQNDDLLLSIEQAARANQILLQQVRDYQAIVGQQTAILEAYLQEFAGINSSNN